MSNSNWNRAQKKYIRLKLWKKSGNVCGLCRLRLLEKWEYFDENNGHPKINIDHKLPVAFGGTNRIPNLQLVHKECNEQKGRDDYQFYAFQKYGTPIKY